MGQQESIFFGESRIWGFPSMDLVNRPANNLALVTPNGAPLQLSKDGDWGLYGASAMYATPAAGGLASNTLVNLQIQDQATAESYFRQSNQTEIIGAPIEHICGKAGNPGYLSWPRVVEGGTRLYPYLGWIDPTGAAAAPTGRTPWYVVMHSKLLRTGLAAAVPIGSRDMQLKKYGGFYVTYSGVFNFTAANPLPVNGSLAIQVPITGKKFFFVDSLWARVANPAIGPNSDLNPLTAEDEILVSCKDTTSLSSWNQPGFVPLWTMFGSRAARAFCPPSPFIVRPLGNIEVTLKNGPTAPVTTRIELTFGGVLVELPESVVREASLLETDGSAVLLGG